MVPPRIIQAIVVQTKIKDRAKMRLVVDIGLCWGSLSAGEEISIAETGPVVNLLSLYFVTQSTSYNQGLLFPSDPSAAIGCLFQAYARVKRSRSLVYISRPRR